MTDRRPHWDDDLIKAVADVLEHDDYIYATTHAVIAAVEDWLGPVEDMIRDANAAQAAEAKIQAVRQLCQSAIDESYLTDASIARAGMANRILRILDGERDARD